MADNFVFTSANDINKEFFGGSSSEKVNIEEVKKEVEQQKVQTNQKTNSKQENKQTENKQNQTSKENSQQQNNKQDQKQENSQQQNPFIENSVKSLKALGFDTKDDKKFFRKIKQFEVQIELP